MEKDEIIIENWLESYPILRMSDLGWQENDYRDALSDDPKKVFAYYQRTSFAFALFYARTREFYVFFQEEEPFVIKRAELNPHWDGRFIGNKITGNFHAQTEVLAVYADGDDIWEGVTIDGLTIAQMMPYSLILF